MAVVIAFARNLAMTGIQGVASVIYTDPVPLNGHDRASAMLMVHYIFTQSVNAVLSYQGQASNDGVNWVDVAALYDATNAATATPRPMVASVNAAWLRFKYVFNVIVGPGVEVGGVCFDLHVKLDHS